MDDICVFAVSYAVYLALDTVYIFTKVGYSAVKFEKYWRYSEGKSNIGLSYLKLFIVPIVLAFVLMSVNDAISKEVKYFDGGSVFVGLDTSNDRSVFCVENGLNNTTNSNLGVQQNIVEYSNVVLSSKYTHHSCFANPDEKGYDKVGIELRLNW